MVVPDPGSFRDPASRVVSDGARVVRLLSDRGLTAWEALRTSVFYHAAVADGRLIETLDLDAAPEGAAGAVEHPRLPLITYPYEWTFTMLKDAALLQLDLLRDALDEGLTIKDATPYNIQFQRGRPIFIDIGSFEPYDDGDAWVGYRQFTRQFLFPLLMHAWVGIPFQPWLRGDLEGPTPAQMQALLPRWRRLHPKALLHVELQARMEARMGARAVRGDLKSAGFSKDMILKNVANLQSLIEPLEPNSRDTGWTTYHRCDHVGRDRSTKTAFLEAAMDRTAPGRVVDLGANDGHFSEIAAFRGAHAIAVDNDEAVLEQLYRRIGGRDISVVLTDLANPSPAQGWSGTERSGLFDRVRPDLVVAYGVIHHLMYGASIPPRAIVSWLRRFECPIVLEYVAPTDEMAVRIIGNRLSHELHGGLGESEFRDALAVDFTTVVEDKLGSGTRLLLHLDPR
jgi:ribosomal protein L11 methylase PrmA